MFKTKMMFQTVRSDGLGTDVCIISQYAHVEEFVSSETYRMEGRKVYPYQCNAQSEGEGCYV